MEAVVISLVAALAKRLFETVKACRDLKLQARLAPLVTRVEALSYNLPNIKDKSSKVIENLKATLEEICEMVDFLNGEKTKTKRYFCTTDKKEMIEAAHNALSRVESDFNVVNGARMRQSILVHLQEDRDDMAEQLQKLYTMMEQMRIESRDKPAANSSDELLGRIANQLEYHTQPSTSARSVDLAPQDVQVDKKAKLGSGGFATVYKGKYCGASVAAKVMEVSLPWF